MKLKISAVSKSFGRKEIFRGLHLSIEKGEITSLFGRNGSGKSTLLKMVFGVLKADSLDLQIDDRHLTPREVIPSQLIAYLPQARFLPARVTVRDLIAMYHQDPATLDQICYAPGITDFEELPCGKLSGGQRKYLEILLIAHLNHPFLLLDEPFSMIDPKYKALIKALLLDLKPSKGILLTDHYYHDVLQLSDKNYLLKNGQIQAVQGEEELRTKGYLSDLMKRSK